MPNKINHLDKLVKKGKTTNPTAAIPKMAGNDQLPFLFILSSHSFSLYFNKAICMCNRVVRTPK